MARIVCGRIAEGESVQAVCRDPDMPHRGTIYRWIKLKPRFAAALLLARQAAGRGARSGQLSTYCPLTAREICERMAEGESVVAICRDPTMPAFSTVYRWRRTFSEFAEMFAEAREAQAERLADEGLEIAAAVTPETAYASHVRLTHLRWATGVFNPLRYRIRQVEPDIPRPPERPVQEIAFRNFTLEKDLERGVWRMVSHCPDPETGRIVRDSEGEWEAMPEPVLAAARDRAREHQARLAGSG